jgi:hypothetical protein
MMSLVQSFGLGRNPAGRYVVLFRYYLLYSMQGIKSPSVVVGYHVVRVNYNTLSDFQIY